MKIPKNGIKITETETIKALVEAANGKAETYTLSGFGVISLAHQAEKMLESKGIALSGRAGCEFSYMSQPPEKQSYKYGVQCSSVRLRRYAEGWRLMAYSRALRFPREPEHMAIHLKPEQVELIKRKALAAALEGVRSLPAKKKPAAAAAESAAA